MKVLVKNLSKSFILNKETIHIFSNINLVIKSSDSYAIIGSSGSGKSTLLHILGGLDKPSSGEVIVQQDDSSDLKGKFQRKFAFIFQEHNLLSELNVLENILLPMYIAGEETDAAQKKALALLVEFGMQTFAEARVFQLSGGQRQKIAIIRAILMNPLFLLADEPTANLDESSALMVISFLLQVKKTYGFGLIISSHDKAVYSQMDHVFKLEQNVLQTP